MEPLVDDTQSALKGPSLVRYSGDHGVSDTVDRTRLGTGSALRRAYAVPGAAPEDMLRLLRQLDDRLDPATG